MGTFFKYVFYIVIIVAVYFIIQGIWESETPNEVTVEEIVEQTGNGMQGNNAPAAN